MKGIKNLKNDFNNDHWFLQGIKNGTIKVEGG